MNSCGLLSTSSGPGSGSGLARPPSYLPRPPSYLPPGFSPWSPCLAFSSSFPTPTQSQDLSSSVTWRLPRGALQALLTQTDLSCPWKPWLQTAGTPHVREGSLFFPSLPVKTPSLFLQLLSPGILWVKPPQTQADASSSGISQRRPIGSPLSKGWLSLREH